MNPLVSTQWLFERLHDPNLVIFDATLSPVGQTTKVDVRGKYLAGHIPGALFFDIEEISDKATDLPHMLPTPNEFSRILSELGVGNEMDIVVYEQDGVFSAPRAWWMLRSFGVKNVFFLDGSLKAWISKDFPIQSGNAHRLPSRFQANLLEGAVKDFSQIQKMLADSSQILDARSSGRFHGTTPEPRPWLSSGHMPGSINIPYNELIVDGRYKASDDLRALFTHKRVDLNRPITTTCGSGVSAAVIALGLEIVGAQQVSLYDGSWTEYAQHPEAVIQK